MTSDVLFFRAAFLRHTSQHYALMLTPDTARHRDQNNDQRRGTITNALLPHHFAGVIALRVPVVVDASACLLALDIEVGGGAALYERIAQSAQCSLWTFEQYCRQPNLAEPHQSEYIEPHFDRCINKHRLQQPGAGLFAAAYQLERGASSPHLAGTARSMCTASARKRSQSSTEPVRRP